MSGATEQTHTIIGETAPRWETKIVVIEDRGLPTEFEYHDYLSAVWYGHHAFSYADGGEDDPDKGYWLISGDNTGSQQLVVHPYMIPALIDLLHKLAEVSP